MMSFQALDNNPVVLLHLCGLCPLFKGPWSFELDTFFCESEGQPGFEEVQYCRIIHINECSVGQELEVSYELVDVAAFHF
jgi:hypothetical protein